MIICVRCKQIRVASISEILRGKLTGFQRLFCFVELVDDFSDGERDATERHQEGGIVLLCLLFESLEGIVVVFQVEFFPQAKAPVSIKESSIL